MMTAQSTAPAGPYAAAQSALGDLGYTCIPLLPRDKAPGQRRGGRWVLMSNWPDFRDRAPTVFEQNAWGSWEGANIGIILGTPIGEHKLIAVDIDSLDPEEVETIRSACPSTPMAKKGAKGLTMFFRGSPSLKSRGYKTAEKRGLCDLLTGNATRQTVVPPSIHPYGPTYTWLAGPVPAHDLPLFDETCLERLEDTLAHLGWGGEAEVQARSTRKPLDTHDDDPSIWSEVNDAALSNMAAWVPALGLYGLRPVSRGGYEAVATWRPSGSGQPIEKRKRNLKIYPDGIRDFGSDVGYSPLDLVCAANNWTLDDSFQWLRDRLDMVEAPIFVVPENVPVTIPPPPVSEVASVPVAPPAYQQQEGEIPADLLDVPGLVGDITRWITRTGRKPQPVLALGAALAIVGTAAGRKFAGPTRSATHLYVLALAPTGAGKNHPLDQIMRTMTVTMPRELGPSAFMSYSAVVKRLDRHPVVLCAMDEFGSFLAKINNRKNSSGHEQAISGVLRTAWGCSFSSMTTPEYASDPSRVIHSPALTIYGASTHEEFYRSLQGADIHNGFLNRFLILSTRIRPDEQEPDLDPYNLPDEIKAGIDQIFYAGNPLATATAHNTCADAPQIMIPWKSPSAQEVYRALCREVQGREAEDSFLARTSEMAIRLATIAALGESSESPAVSEANMRWGAALAMWSANRMIAETGQFMSENDRQSEQQLVLRLIVAGDSLGKGRISQGELTRKINGRLDASRVKSILAALMEGEQVEESREEVRGKVKRIYRALQ